MDKIAANNYVVTMKKEIKKAKAMVSGNLIRRISEIKAEKEILDDQDKINKIEEKITGILDQVKLIKTLDSYTITKSVTLKPDLVFWSKLISDDKAAVEDRLSARIVSKNNVKKQITKFRDDHKECDQWLNEYFEYREKKKEIVSDSREPNKSRNKRHKFDTDNTNNKKKKKWLKGNKN